MAERERFELSIQVVSVYSLGRRAPRNFWFNNIN